MSYQNEKSQMHHAEPQIAPFGRLLRPVALAGCAVLLVACQSNREVTGSVSEDYRLRHPITLEQSAKTIDIPVGMHSEALTPASRSAITGFARDFLYENAAVIQIMVPSGGENESSAGYLAKKIRTHLMRNKVRSDRIDTIAYSAAGSSGAPIRLAYPRVAAKTLPCGTHPDGLKSSGENFNYFDFGCSTQQNLAAMVSNPQDLIQPRGWTERDSMRRSAITEKYRKGEPTWSEDLGNKSGSSSEVSK